jgi:ABC-type nickel/cobalt efflux system permease component RcnA
VLLLGLLLGIRHAFDADHLVAVTTIVSEYRNPLRAIWVGVSWGLGHTTTLFLAGGALLLLDLHVPEKVALSFEFAVGLMLIVLGIQTLHAFRQHKVHFHSHVHNGKLNSHEHFHSHEDALNHDHPHLSRFDKWARLMVAGIVPGEHHASSAKGGVTPFFRLKSYVVGTVHGMAGSAALMLLVLANIRAAWAGVTYILIFGLGTVVSMGLISIVISIPFAASSRLPRLNRIIQASAGTFSIVFGLVLMYQIGIAGGLFAR